MVYRYPVARDQDPSTALAMALCDVEGVSPGALDPLYHHVNLDALDKLVDPDCSLVQHSDCTAIISMRSYWISINQDSIVIWCLEDDDPQEAVKWR